MGVAGAAGFGAEIGRQLSAEKESCPVQARFCRRGTEVEDLRGGGAGKFFDLAQDEDRAVLAIEPVNGRRDQRPGFAAQGAVLRARQTSRPLVFPGAARAGRDRRVRDRRFCGVACASGRR